MSASVPTYAAASECWLSRWMKHELEFQRESEVKYTAFQQ